MKKRVKREIETYSFDEYKKKFSPPSRDKNARVEVKPFDRGVKLAEEILARVRNQIHET